MDIWISQILADINKDDQSDRCAYYGSCYG